jgi:hypothetical protein
MYVCLRSSCHTYGQNVNIENQCLYYMNIVFYREDYYRLSHRAAAETPTPQAIDRGQRKPLKEIFIIVVHLISVF